MLHMLHQNLPAFQRARGGDHRGAGDVFVTGHCIGASGTAHGDEGNPIHWSQGAGNCGCHPTPPGFFSRKEWAIGLNWMVKKGKSMEIHL